MHTLDTVFVMILIPGHPKRNCSSQIRVEVYGGQVISGVLAQIFSTVGHFSPRTHPVVISAVPECLFGIDTLSSRQNSPINSPTCGVMTIMMEKPSASH